MKQLLTNLILFLGLAIAQADSLGNYPQSNSIAPADFFLTVYTNGDGTFKTHLTPAGNLKPPMQYKRAEVSTNIFPNVLTAQPGYTYGIDLPILFLPNTNGTYLLNPDQDLIGGNAFAMNIFTPPLGTTQVVASVSAGTLAGNGTLQFGFCTSAYGAIAYTNYGLTTTMSNLTVTAGRSDQMCLLFLNNGGNGFVLSNLNLTCLPNPTNAGLTGPFYRYEIARKHIKNSSGFGYLNYNRYWDARHQPPSSTIQFDTTAPSFSMDVYCGQGVSPFYIYVNGSFWGSISPANSGELYQWLDITGLPVGQINTVEVISPYSSDYNYTSVRAVCALQSYYLKLYEWPNNYKAFIAGDSILASICNPYDYQWTTKGVFERLTEYNVTFSASGSDSLFRDLTYFYGGRMMEIGSLQPAIALDNYGFNDWKYGTYNTNTFQTAYAAYLDEVHKVSPATQYYVVTPTPAGVYETSNLFTFTLEGFRQAKRLAIVGRTNWCVLVEGTNILQANQLGSDNIHPAVYGCSQIGKRLAKFTFDFSVRTNNIP